MNRGEARTRTRLYLNERTAAQWSDAELDDLLLDAENEVFEEIVFVRPDIFTKVKRFNLAANAFSVDLSTQTDTGGVALGEYWKILGLFVVPENSAAGRTNMPRPFYPAQSLVDLYKEPRSSNYDVKGSDEQWLEHGGSLYVNPVSSTARYLWIHLLPRLNVTSADGNVLLSVDAGSSSPIVQAHDLIPMMAAIKALSSVKDQPGVLATTYSMRRKALLNLLQSSTNAMEPRRVGR